MSNYFIQSNLLKSILKIDIAVRKKLTMLFAASLSKYLSFECSLKKKHIQAKCVQLHYIAAPA